MQRLTFSSTPESQIDPFNAPDPVMPGEEPGWLVDDARDEEGPSYAPHGERDGEPHKDSDDYRAPTTRGHDYDAPSIDEAPKPARRPAAQSLGRQWQQAADAARRGGAAASARKVTNWAVIVFVAFVLLGMFGDVLAGCAHLVGETASNGFDAVLLL